MLSGNPQLQMILAGLCLGVWQILVSRAGFPAPVANLTILVLSAAFAVFTAQEYASTGSLTAVGALVLAVIIAMVVAFHESVPPTFKAYALMTVAGILSGIAVWQLNDVITSVPAAKVGAYALLMTGTQLAAWFAYYLAMQAIVLRVFPTKITVAFVLMLVAVQLVRMELVNLELKGVE